MKIIKLSNHAKQQSKMKTEVSFKQSNLEGINELDGSSFSEVLGNVRGARKQMKGMAF